MRVSPFKEREVDPRLIEILERLDRANSFALRIAAAPTPRLVAAELRDGLTEVLVQQEQVRVDFTPSYSPDLVDMPVLRDYAIGLLASAVRHPKALVTLVGFKYEASEKRSRMQPTDPEVMAFVLGMLTDHQASTAVRQIEGWSRGARIRMQDLWVSQEAQAYLRAQPGTGEFVDPSPAGLGTHEWGHALHRTVFGSIGETGQAYDISPYGATDYGESVAEGFAATGKFGERAHEGAKEHYRDLMRGLNVQFPYSEPALAPTAALLKFAFDGRFPAHAALSRAFPGMARRFASDRMPAEIERIFTAENPYLPQTPEAVRRQIETVGMATGPLPEVRNLAGTFTAADLLRDKAWQAKTGAGRGSRTQREELARLLEPSRPAR